MHLLAHEVRAHLGYDYGHYAQAQLGRRYDEAEVVAPPLPIGGAAPIVLVPATRFVPAARPTSTPWPWYVDTVGEEVPVDVSAAALRAADLSRQEEMKDWAEFCALLTSTEDECARRIFKTVQDLSYRASFAKARRVDEELSVFLAAAYAAAGLHSAIVVQKRLRDNEHVLVAVFSDEGWHYADPDLPFGLTKLFDEERYALVPRIPRPRSEEVVALAVREDRARETLRLGVALAVAGVLALGAGVALVMASNKEKKLDRPRKNPPARGAKRPKKRRPGRPKRRRRARR